MHISHLDHCLDTDLTDFHPEPRISSSVYISNTHTDTCVVHLPIALRLIGTPKLNPIHKFEYFGRRMSRR